MNLPEFTQWFQQVIIHGQFADGSGFAAGHDQTIQLSQVGGQAYFGSLHAQTFEHDDMFSKIALDGQHSDFHKGSQTR